METIGIVGSGTMGLGIAQVLAAASRHVILYDHQKNVLDQAKDRLHKNLQKQIAKGRMTEKQAATLSSHITFAESWEKLQPSDLVIEAIIENLPAKRELFQRLEALVSEKCVLATNTSSMSVTAIASACKLPHRVIGLHFFNPAPVMALVEIIPAVQTSKGLEIKLRHWVESIGKQPVIAKDTPGFIVNRLVRPYYGEALRILEEDLATAALIDFSMTTVGQFPMGPFQLMDYIGNDINFQVSTTIFEGFFFDPRYKPSFTQKRLVEAGYLGRKSGRGFFDYQTDDYLLQQQYLHKNLPDQPLLERIFKRILVMLINEAAEALYYRLASREDLDLAVMRGVNYPQGLLRWADSWGIPAVVAHMDELYNHYHEDRYRCSPLLRKLLAENRGFYTD